MRTLTKTELTVVSGGHKTAAAADCGCGTDKAAKIAAFKAALATKLAAIKAKIAAHMASSQHCMPPVTGTTEG